MQKNNGFNYVFRQIYYAWTPDSLFAQIFGTIANSGATKCAENRLSLNICPNHTAGQRESLGPVVSTKPRSAISGQKRLRIGPNLGMCRKFKRKGSPDIARQPFSGWNQLASLEPAGDVHNEDIWIAADGSAHFLWLERSIDSRLRKLLPEIPDRTVLWHALLRDGKVVSRQPLVEFNLRGVRPNQARFHVTSEGRLFVFFSAYEPTYETSNRLLEIYPDGQHSDSIKLRIEHPLEVFLSAGQRNGALPSSYMDLLGIPIWGNPPVHYVRVRIK